MKQIFANLIPYWKTVILILVLLTVQAYCDLSLPQYTSDIIDTGIQNQGIEHILPEKIVKEEYEMAGLFMTSDEKQSWENSYEAGGDIYSLKITDEERLAELDEELLIPVVMNHKMANLSESDFKDMVIQSVPEDAQAEFSKQIQNMSVDEIGQMMQLDLKTFEAEDENGTVTCYADVRPLVQQMAASGQMPAEKMQQSRASLEDMLASIGSNTLFSMGVSYAAACEEAAGIDLDAVQMDYLWAQGLKMFLMALLMLGAAVGTGFLASRVGAGVGRELRGNVFSKVVGFSNAEMDQFSTASLITRSTNDIQQIQMVTAILLRMVLYAPILGIGGIYKVIQTGAHMGWIIILAVVLILGFVLVLMSITMPKFQIMQKLVDALNLVSREILTGLFVIRAFGREKKEEERFDEANRNLTKTQLFTMNPHGNHSFCPV